MDRREFLKAAAALGGLAAINGRALANTTLLGGTSRASNLSVSEGLVLAHTDLHNHTLISGDALGDPGAALAQMRARGIDVACLTEHAISGKHHGELTCRGHEQGGCHTVEGINQTDWQTMNYIADVANEPGAFVSFRGFEYSTPTVGHLNVYFTQEFTDALHEHAFFTPPAAAELDRVGPFPPELVDNFEQLPDIATMRFFWEWFNSAPDRALFGGGSDGIACFNHPGEFGDFEDYAYDAAAAPRVISYEALNADRDFFWFGADEGMPNQVNRCLDAGWRVGFTGVSDEHGSEFGRPGMARGGLWVTDLSRAAVREALLARRSFATFNHGLKLDATANGAQMGSVLPPGSGMVDIELDLGGGSDDLVVEVVTPGPTIAAKFDATGSGLTQVSFPEATLGSSWFFLRICDTTTSADSRATGAFVEDGGVVAYASPWFFG